MRQCTLRFGRRRDEHSRSRGVWLAALLPARRRLGLDRRGQTAGLAFAAEPGAGGIGVGVRVIELPGDERLDRRRERWTGPAFERAGHIVTLHLCQTRARAVSRTLSHARSNAVPGAASGSAVPGGASRSAPAGTISLSSSRRSMKLAYVCASDGRSVRRQRCAKNDERTCARRHRIVDEAEDQRCAPGHGVDVVVHIDRAEKQTCAC